MDGQCGILVRRSGIGAVDPEFELDQSPTSICVCKSPSETMQATSMMVCLSMSSPMCSSSTIQHEDALPGGRFTRGDTPLPASGTVAL